MIPTISKFLSGRAANLQLQEDNRSPWKVSLKEAGTIFLSSRFLLLIITFVGVSKFIQVGSHGTIVRPQECAWDFVHCLRVWDAWDFGLFITIAMHGFTRPELSAFFPLWPLLMRCGAFFSASDLSLFFSGLILANLCFYGALVLLHQLVQREFGAGIAQNTLFLITFNPYGLFFFLGYSESLFLLLCLAMIFFLLRGHSLDWWLAGFCGFAVVWTRGAGIVLAFPFLAIFLQRFWRYRREWREHWRSWLLSILPICLLPLALLLYMFYLSHTFGDPFAFSTGELQGWGRHLTYPWMGIVQAVQSIFANKGSIDSNVREISFTIVSLMVLAIGWKYLSWPYRIFSISQVLFSLCYPVDGRGNSLVGMPRFFMIIFPLFMICAIYGEKYPKAKKVLILLSIALFTLQSLIFLIHTRLA